MGTLGTPERPLRVAIVGAGPSGFYAAAALLKPGGAVAEVDLVDRLPTPYGLVRGGVAPDHQNIKAVIKAYEKTAADPRFRFYGNVRVGSDLTTAELYDRYDAVIWAVGAEADRRLGIPGEDLPGSHSATEFVGWYNGHPDFRDRSFDLRDVRSVVVVGVGNVAMDVTRVLAKNPADLAATDITDEALAVLRESGVREVWILGRRGSAQAKFSPAEIKEIGELAGSELVVRPEDGAADPVSAEWLAAMDPRERANVQKNLDYLATRVAAGEGDSPRKVRLAMCASPVAILGDDRVRGVRVERTRLVPAEGEPSAQGTGETFEIEAQMVFRAVGYKGIPLAGVPFDAKKGIIPNADGRVLDGGVQVPKAYVVGWAKRGPTGLIGTNRADSIATVESLVADLAGKPADADRTAASAEAFLRARVPALVTFADWKRLDAIEIAEGGQRGKVRHKFVRPEDALDALKR